MVNPLSETLSPSPKFSALDNNGNPAVGYKLFTYIAGTSTKLATYTDSSGGVPNSNPVILDYRGEANVWIPPNVSYKYVFARPNDTDPPGAPVWTVDSIINSQFTTSSLYGGVDTGAANAYVLTFASNFTSYEDGIVIYWLPANANTGASTINVNGLGPVAIVNQNGAALVAGQIMANQFAQVIYKGTGFVLAGPVQNYPLNSSGSSLSIATLAVGQSAYIFKTANTSRASNDTPTLDPVLQFTSAPAGSYVTEGVLRYSADTTGDLQVAWPNATSGMMVSGAPVSVGLSVAAWPMSTVPAPFDGVPLDVQLDISIYGLEVLASTGTLGPTWAQETSNAAATIMRAGSWLKVTRVS